MNGFAGEVFKLHTDLLASFLQSACF